MATCRYPKEIATAQTKDKTFAIAAELYPADPANGEGPLKFYAGYSRFIFSIIHKDNGRTIVPTANLSTTEAAGLILASEQAMNAHTLLSIPAIQSMMAMVQGSQEKLDGFKEGMNSMFLFMRDGKLPAKKQRSVPEPQYANVKLTVGKLKGSAPLELVKADPANREALIRLQNWLQENVEKYPGNRQQIDAIAEAITFLDNGWLNEVSAEASNQNNTIILHESGPRGNVRKKDPATGLSPVFEMEILWHFDDKYPLEIKISNYQAPIDVRENGQINVRSGQASNRIIASYRLTQAQWAHHISRIRRTMELFEMCHAMHNFQMAEEIADRNRREALEKKRRQDNYGAAV